jgi:hypothetical protein
VIRAGAAVEEHLLESAYFDLVTGGAVPESVAARCRDVERAGRPRGRKTAPPNGALAPARPMLELVQLMVDDLKRKLESRVERLRADAERTLSAELERIDSYYHGLLEDAAAKRERTGVGGEDDATFANAARAIETEHARRRLEEERRHDVRTAVHPLQLIEIEVVVERARWSLTGSRARRATLSVMRYVAGAGSDWDVRCPSCRAEIAELVLRDDGRVGCGACQKIDKDETMRGTPTEDN